jgi:hypothetical protein
MDAIDLFVAANSRAAQERLIVLLLIGFGIGAFGHLIGSRLVVAIGVAIFFLASFLIPLLLYSG